MQAGRLERDAQTPGGCRDDRFKSSRLSPDSDNAQRFVMLNNYRMDNSNIPLQVADISGILSSLADFPRSRNSGPFPHISGSWKGFSMYPPLRQYSKVPTRSEIVTSH